VMHKKREFKTEHFSFEEANDRIRDVFRNHDFDDVTHAQRRQLTEFFLMLMDEQKNHNSTRLRTLREVALKHYVDCLMVLRVTKLEFPLLDVGTGPGFPGIPLKIMRPDDQIILAEGVQKRVEFLKKVREKLQLKNLDIIGRQVNMDFFYPVRAAITRAFADTSETLIHVSNCVQTGGKVFLMKGPNVEDEVKASKKLSKTYKLIQNTAYSLPNSPHERRMLVFEKIGPLEAGIS
jgi:16S rRNA (guanine527-N7)-methyltransferase